MKILLVSDQLLIIDGDNIYGTPNFTNTLKRLSKIGELYVCVRDAKKHPNSILVYNDLINDYIKKENIAFIPKSFIWPSIQTQNILKNQIAKVDLVIGYIPALNAEVAQFLAHKAGKKYLGFLVACPWDGLWNQDWKRKIAAPYRMFLNKKVMRNADYAHYVTSEFLQNRYPTSAQKSLGLSDVVLEKMDTQILKNRLSKINNMSNQETIKIATTAMLNIKYKGQRFVLRALKELKNKGYNNFKYYLIGGGDNSALLQQTQMLGLSENVIFVGKVTHDEVFKILDDIDIYVHPSLQEGLPRSVVEAMSRALPVIGASTGAIPELINPDFIVKRKSVDQIVQKLIELMNPKKMAQEAERNFNEAKKFECARLDQLRNEFYLSIAKDFNKDNQAQ